jgi:Plant transposon protein
MQEPVGRKACQYAVWQESARKDVERAFGVLQRKFQVLVKKVELWYVSDIANIVKCSLCLHNMMVATRMAQGEEESEEFYAFPGLAQDEDDMDGGLADEAEQVYVDRRVAEMQLHEELYGTNNHQDHRMTDRERQVLESLRFQYVQRRWECLYDLQEHHRLRNAIMQHIEAK